MGLLRLLTQPKVMKQDVLTPVNAWDFVDGLCLDDQIGYVEEPSGIEEKWRELARKKQFSGASAWTDSYLTSFASVAGYTLVTLDRALAHGEDCRVKLLP